MALEGLANLKPIGEPNLKFTGQTSTLETEADAVECLVLRSLVFCCYGVLDKAKIFA